MRFLYARQQRASIYQPATIGDIPKEVMRKAFIYLLPGQADLVAPSEACRAWRPIVQEIMYSCQAFGDRWRKDFERFLCGFYLQSLVFGVGSVSINRLKLDTRSMTRENTLILAQIVAPSISSLTLSGDRLPSMDCYAVMEVFFLHCRQIRSLKLIKFDFGDDPASISSAIKEGFGCLKKLDLIDCKGDVRMFVEKTPIHKLQNLQFESGREEDSDIVMSMAEKYRTITSIEVFAAIASFSPLLKVVECCRDLVSFTICGDDLVLEPSDIKALASLPRLKFLDVINCGMEDEAVSALSQCRKLKHLGIECSDGLDDILRVIGMDLISLDIQSAAAEAWLGIVENCPNLEYIQLYGEELKDAVMIGSLNDGLKKRMKKRLASMKVNCVPVRLGTEWKGY
jgi:hypothetical protein